MFYNEFINGFIQRDREGRYTGHITIDGIDLSPIEATFFEDSGRNYLWIKRPPVKEYNWDTASFKTRQPKPQWESYLEKQVNENVVEYKGTFAFMRFRYSIVGVWDSVFGREKQRLNLFVERLPMLQQSILTSINERKLKEQHTYEQDRF